MRYWILASGLLPGLSLFLSKVLASKLQDVVQERCECRFRFGVGFFLLFFLHGIPSEVVGRSGVIFGVPRPRHRFSLRASDAILFRLEMYSSQIFASFIPVNQDSARLGVRIVFDR